MPRIFSSVLVWLRFVVVALWLAAAAATFVYLPGLGSARRSSSAG